VTAATTLDAAGPNGHAEAAQAQDSPASSGLAAEG
jgi:hypothetical protein